MIKILFGKKMAVLGIGLTAITLTSGNIFAATATSTIDSNSNCNVSITEKQEALNQKVVDGTLTQEKADAILKILEDLDENNDENENKNGTSNKSSNKIEDNKQKGEENGAYLGESQNKIANNTKNHANEK